MLSIVSFARVDFLFIVVASHFQTFVIARNELCGAAMNDEQLFCAARALLTLGTAERAAQAARHPTYVQWVERFIAEHPWDFDAGHRQWLSTTRAPVTQLLRFPPNAAVAARRLRACCPVTAGKLSKRAREESALAVDPGHVPLPPWTVDGVRRAQSGEVPFAVGRSTAGALFAPDALTMVATATARRGVDILDAAASLATAANGVCRKASSAMSAACPHCNPGQLKESTSADAVQVPDRFVDRQVAAKQRLVPTRRHIVGSAPTRAVQLGVVESVPLDTTQRSESLSHTVLLKESTVVDALAVVTACVANRTERF